MSNTQEDVRLILEGHRAHITGPGGCSICAATNRLRAHLAAYEALGSVEYLAALVRLHKDAAAYQAIRRKLRCTVEAIPEMNDAAQALSMSIDKANSLAAHDEAERLREGT